MTWSSMIFFGQTSTRTVYEWARLNSFSEPWQVPLLLAVCALVVVFVVYMYRRDSADLRPGVGVVLMALRLAAFAGLLLVFLELQKRTEQKVVENSRVLLMVDTSLSMQERDDESSSSPSMPTRLEQTVNELTSGQLLDQLRATHDVEIVRFDRDSASVATLSRLASGTEQPENAAGSASNSESELHSRLITELNAQGAETRLGQAVQQWIAQRRTNPLAAVVVFSDGGHNAGLDPAAAAEMARTADVPVFAVGLGSDQRPTNVRIADFRVPPRAYPGDAFSVSGLIEAQGVKGREAKVQLLSRRADLELPDGAESWTLIEAKNVQLGEKASPVTFEVATLKEHQRYVLRLVVEGVADDANETDNRQEADVEIVDRKDRVLLLAGGPSREYQFLRNQLRRDQAVVVDVLLQTAQPGISQDANAILDEFPATFAELAEYDCVIAFDPDWKALPAEAIDLLERWVAEMSGGLILVAGPVHTDSWASDPKMAKLQGLYPVEFRKRIAVLDEGEFGSEEPRPLQFSTEGLESDFLWLADWAAASREAWDTFPGVFGYYRVRGEKPGATVYARFADPDAIGEMPIYMAGQYYAAGRVFYLGSGEMWRLRTEDENYFDQFYTKLIRHVTQGRLLRGSRKDNLIVEDRHIIGSVVDVRAQLTDAQHEPLTLPEVPVEIIRPDNQLETVSLTLDPTRAGLYVGRFPVTQEGGYRLTLSPPGAEEPLSRRLQVRVPDLERENPQRNDAPLSLLAQRSGGLYYVGLKEMAGANGKPPLASQIKDRTETTFLLGDPDLDWQRRWSAWLLAGVCGCLCLEWLIRRLSRLA